MGNAKAAVCAEEQDLLLYRTRWSPIGPLCHVNPWLSRWLSAEVIRVGVHRTPFCWQDKEGEGGKEKKSDDPDKEALNWRPLAPDTPGSWREE